MAKYSAKVQVLTGSPDNATVVHTILFNDGFRYSRSFKYQGQEALKKTLQEQTQEAHNAHINHLTMGASSAS